MRKKASRLTLIAAAALAASAIGGAGTASAADSTIYACISKNDGFPRLVTIDGVKGVPLTASTVCKGGEYATKMSWGGTGATAGRRSVARRPGQLFVDGRWVLPDDWYPERVERPKPCPMANAPLTGRLANQRRRAARRGGPTVQEASPGGRSLVP